MKNSPLVLLRSLLFSGLLATAGSVQAAYQPCTISDGNPRGDLANVVVRDDNNNGIPDTTGVGLDSHYTLLYDAVAVPQPLLQYQLNGSAQSTSPISQSANIMSLPGFGLIFSQWLGNPVFNHGKLFAYAEFAVFRKEFQARFPRASDYACLNAFAGLFLKNDISMSNLVEYVEGSDDEEQLLLNTPL